MQAIIGGMKRTGIFMTSPIPTKINGEFLKLQALAYL